MYSSLKLAYSREFVFLRNGGNVYELQMALGHTTLDMVRTYLALAETDLQRAHETASPVTRWRLSGK